MDRLEALLRRPDNIYGCKPDGTAAEDKTQEEYVPSAEDVDTLTRVFEFDTQHQIISLCYYRMSVPEWNLLIQLATLMQKRIDENNEE
jgi:hypothetical protein